MPTLSRRSVLAGLAGAAALPLLGAGSARADMPGRIIPSSGEAIPAIGLGTWITFNVGSDERARARCVDVMRAFFEAGGGMIDSSPMYGSSQPVVGEGLAELGHPPGLFSAEKVWTRSAEAGRTQIEETRRYWGVDRFDLMQVHNLVAWEPHLDTLFAMKDAGELRYVGITTSAGRRHGDVEAIMRDHPVDFVQVTYNPLDRAVEERILPLARERGIAVICNRTFRQGALTRRLERVPLPDWAGEIGAQSWAQAILKYVLAHEAVTCAIPATTRVDHVRENMAAAHGEMPDEALRRRIAADIGNV